jgi:hypothetical protein
MAKFKQKLKKVDAEQMLVDTFVDFGDGVEDLVPAGAWVLSKGGVPYTFYHDVVFQEEYEPE